MEENAEKVGFIKRIGISILKPSQYYKLAEKKVGNTIGTFAIISIIQVVFLMGLLITLIYTKAIPVVDEYVDKIPEFEVSSENGLTIENGEPISYDDNGIFIMIDSTVANVGELKEIFSEQIYSCEDYILLAHRDVEIKNDNEVQTIVFSEIEMPVITKQSLVDWYVNFKNSIIPVALIVIAIIATMFTFVATLFSGLLLSLIGLIIAETQKQSLPFGKIYNVAMYSRVMVIILGLLGTTFMLDTLVWFIIKLVIEVLYMVYGLDSIKKINVTKQSGTIEIE